MGLEQRALAHGIVPWLLNSLTTEVIGQLPSDLVPVWKRSEQLNRVRVLANWSVATRVLKVLEGTGIRAVPIKGVALSQQLYGAPWMRPAGDVDVLIHRQCVRKAHSAMRAAGFAVQFPNWEPTPSQWDWILRNKKHACYRDRRSETLIELHWRMHNHPLLNNRDESWTCGTLQKTGSRSHGRGTRRTDTIFARHEPFGAKPVVTPDLGP
jgi:hypothetical protein